MLLLLLSVTVVTEIPIVTILAVVTFFLNEPGQKPRDVDHKEKREIGGWCIKLTKRIGKTK